MRRLLSMPRKQFGRLAAILLEQAIRLAVARLSGESRVMQAGVRQTVKLMVAVVLAASLGFSSTASVAQNDSKLELREDAPKRYVVQQGDTLWALANRFLKDPWRWPLIWQSNENVANPHLIFPGDLLVITGLDNLKVVRLKPKVRRSSLDRGIPAIPPNVIQPFLTSPLIVEPGELNQAGYVLQGIDDQILLGKYSQFYSRALADLEANQYRVFNVGQPLIHPDSAEVLGVEAKHLGDARMLKSEEGISKMVVIDSHEDIRPGDRILPFDEFEPLSYFEPRAPDHDVEGWIIRAPQGVKEVGRFDVVIISGGSREGLEQGHVLRAMYRRSGRKDPVTGEFYTPPDESSGLMMVFRVFEKVSYALVMETNRQINIGDYYIKPKG